MPKVSQAHMESRRGQILQAAFRCFSRKGFHSTTMREICREAGLSPGGVYTHFAGKKEIIEALAEKGRGQTRNFFDSVPQAQDCVQSLGKLMTALVESLELPECSRGLRLDIRLWGEALNDHTVRRLFLQGFQNVNRPFAELVQRGQQQGQVSPTLSSQAVGRVLVALQLGLTLQKAVDPKADMAACKPVISALLQGLNQTEERASS